MKTIELNATVREGLGKNAVKKVRAEGLVPGVIYGQGEPQAIAVNFNGINKALHSPDTFIVNLKVDGKEVKSIIREAQYHPVHDQVLHVDFLSIADGNSIELELPIKLVGTAKGVLNGGKLVPLMRKLKVRGVPAELPESVNIDITNLTLGKTIKVEDLNISGLDITSPSSAGIAAVEVTRAIRTGEVAAVDEEEEGGEEAGSSEASGEE